MKTRTAICIALWLASSAIFDELSAGPAAAIEGAASVDFGRYPAKEPKTAVFSISNQGDEPLKILGVRNTCECVESGISAGAEFEAQSCDVPPGSRAALKLKVLSDSLHEPYAKNVYVQTNDPENKFLVFKISGDAIPILKAIPQAEIVAGHIRLDAPWTYELRLEATEDGVELGTPKCESEIPVKASTESVGGRAFNLKIEMAPRPNAPGRFSSKMRIPIVKPDGWWPLEVNISGFAGIELLASPSKIFIPNDKSARFEKKIALRIFSPEQMTLSPDEISFVAPEGVFVKLSGGDGELVVAKIAIESSALKSLGKSSTLEFKMPGAQSLSVPLIRRQTP